MVRKPTWILLTCTLFMGSLVTGLFAADGESASARTTLPSTLTLDSKLLSPHAQRGTSAIGLPSITAVTLDGKLLSTQVREIDGRSYIPVEDIARTLSLSTTVDAKLGIIRLESPPKTAPEQKVDRAKLEAAKATLHALESLQSAVEVGITQVDYFRKLSDANTEYKRLIDGYGEKTRTFAELYSMPEAQVHTCADHLTLAVGLYSKAGEAWQHDDTIYRHAHWKLASEHVDKARTALKEQGP